VSIRGELTSNLACRGPERVVLKKGGSTIGPISTDSTGAYRFTTVIAERTVVQVVFSGGASCDPAVSKMKTINVI